jgi:nicotinamide-nucleotide amidase
MTAESVSVGTELLLGDTVDTNSAELGKTLAQFGVVHLRRQTVGDNLGRLVEALQLALSRTDLVFTIGGLGPTQDDLTREGIAEAVGVELVFDPGVEAGIRSKLESRRIPWVASQSRQAMVLPGAEVLENPNGTAPGLLFRKGGKTVVAMPGPPTEFVPMLHGPVRGYLLSLGLGVVHSRVVRIVGMGESLVEHRLRDLMSSADPSVAPYAKPGEVHVRVTSHGADVEEAAARTDPVVAEVLSRLGDVVYGLDGESLEATVLSLLRSRGETLAVAESCTGGLFGARVTSVPGSSDVFLGGVVSYSNALKESLLGVSRATLEVHGAVSEECAREMAAGACARTGASWGVSVTGIAGPDGGTDEKPVGLVFIGVHGPDGTTVERNVFPGGREAVRARSATWALGMLRRRVLTSSAR